MASLQLYNSHTNLHETQQRLPRIVASTSAFIRVKSSLKSCRFYRFATILQPSSPKDLRISCSSSTAQESPLRIGIVGLGAFGQFLANAFQRQGHDVLGTSRSDYSEYCQKHGIEFFRDLDDLCDAQPDVLLVCSSILSTETIVRGLPFHKLKFNTIIADVLSVKQFPKSLFLELVPSGFGILCTHPMFGKYSGKNSWEGLRFVYDKVRISTNSEQERNCERFLSIFQDQGCRMVEMTCEDHDQYAAESQFVTHTVARILSHMKIESTPVDTKGYEILVELTRNTVSHGSDLYDGLFLYNVNSANQIKKLEKAFEAVKQNLFNKLRDTYREQIEEPGNIEEQAIPMSQMLPSPEEILKDISSFSTTASDTGRTRK